MKKADFHLATAYTLAFVLKDVGDRYVLSEFRKLDSSAPLSLVPFAYSELGTI